MHYLITLLVTGDDAKSALFNADQQASEMCGEERDFDWYNMKGRWGDSEAVRADSSTGAALIKAAMESQYEEFLHNAEPAKYMFENFTAKEIYEEDFSKIPESKRPEGCEYLSRYTFRCLYGSGTDARVFAPESEVWGGPVGKERDLAVVLKKDDLWVVQVDFHS